MLHLNANAKYLVQAFEPNSAHLTKTIENMHLGQPKQWSLHIQTDIHSTRHVKMCTKGVIFTFI